MAPSLGHLARKVLGLSARDWVDLMRAQWALLVAQGLVRNRPIGALATQLGIGIGVALSVTSAFFVLAALLIFTLPDRSGQALEA